MTEAGGATALRPRRARAMVDPLSSGSVERADVSEAHHRVCLRGDAGKQEDRYEA